MTARKILFAAAAIAAVFAMQNSAQALTITECSAKYKDAKAAGTLNGATCQGGEERGRLGLCCRRRERGVPECGGFEIFE